MLVLQRAQACSVSNHDTDFVVDSSTVLGLISDRTVSGLSVRRSMSQQGCLARTSSRHMQLMFDLEWPMRVMTVEMANGTDGMQFDGCRLGPAVCVNVCASDGSNSFSMFRPLQLAVFRHRRGSSLGVGFQSDQREHITIFLSQLTYRACGTAVKTEYEHLCGSSWTIAAWECSANASDTDSCGICWRWRTFHCGGGSTRRIAP